MTSHRQYRLWGLALAALLGACGRFEATAIGDDDAIIVVCDPEEWAALEADLRAVFEEVVVTPQPEPVFRVVHITPDAFRLYTKWYNLVALAPLDSEGDGTRLVSGMLAPDALAGVAEGRYFVFERRNEFARGQVMMVLAGPDAGALRENLRQNVEPLRLPFYEQRRDAVHNRLFGRADASDVSALLEERYGWRLQLPAGFVRAQELPDSNLVWLRRFDPDQFILVWWIDAMTDAALTPEWLLQKRREILHRHANGMEVVDQFLTTDRVRLGRFDAIRWRGLWRIPEKVLGGPFACYGIYDAERRRIFMIDVAVFAPDREKVPLILEMEVIMETFRVPPLPPS